ncbi:MAG TPA: glycosyltransferase [Anaerolineales bacterium]|nr:glycosyltransferase [Anaerolineales bacterium]
MSNSSPPQRPKIHVIYEYGVDYRPHASSYVRLLRPLSHPRTAEWAQFSYGREIIPPGTDLVIVDRLWRPDITLQLAEKLLDEIRYAGAKFICCLDDNLLDLPLERLDWPRPEHLAILRYWLQQADGVMVSTPYLSERLQPFNSRIFTIANALDERLLVRRPIRPAVNADRRLVIGYMGTQTHDEDLRLILPALRAINDRRPGQVVLEIIGVTSNPETLESLHGLPVRWISPDARESEYPLFMLWFTSQVNWDIALAPLRDTIFTRAKSDIKYLDYASIGAPAIFSDVAAYSATIQNGQNGVLVANTSSAWESAIESLITSTDLRHNLAHQANSELYNTRIINCCAVNWESALKSFL